MTGLNDADEVSTDAPLADRHPGRAVEDAADRLRRRDPAFRVEARHESRCALNAAGTDETMKTTHSIVAHVPRDRARDFERAARERVVELGIEIAKRDDSTRGDRRFVLRPQRPDDGRDRGPSGVDEL